MPASPDPPLGTRRLRQLDLYVARIREIRERARQQRIEMLTQATETLRRIQEKEGSSG